MRSTSLPSFDLDAMTAIERRDFDLSVRSDTKERLPIAIGVTAQGYRNKLNSLAGLAHVRRVRARF